MALNKTETAAFDTLKALLDVLVDVAGMPVEEAFAGIADKIAQFEADTHHKVVLAPARGEDGSWLSVADMTRDYLRVQTASDINTLLRARSLGVSLEVRVARADAYSHDNEKIALALDRVAAAVRKSKPLAEAIGEELAYSLDVLESLPDDNLLAYEEFAEQDLPDYERTPEESARAIVAISNTEPVMNTDPEERGDAESLGQKEGADRAENSASSDGFDGLEPLNPIAAEDLGRPEDSDGGASETDSMDSSQEAGAGLQEAEQKDAGIARSAFPSSPQRKPALF